MTQDSFARVAVNIPQLSGLFDYFIPSELAERVSVGSLVTVPFGRQITQGIVVELPPEPSVADPRPLASLVDNDPVVTRAQISLAQWMAAENLASLAECLELMLPPGLSQQADLLIHLVSVNVSSQLTPTQQRIMALLQKRGDLRGKQLDRAMPHTDWRKSLPGLEKLGLVTREPILKTPTAKARLGRSVGFISMPASEEITRQLGRPGSQVLERRLKVLEFLKEEPAEVLVNFVYAETGANAADLTRLADLNLIRFAQAEIWRDPLEKIKLAQSTALKLTPEQQAALDFIKQQINESKKRMPVLLQGVTGSGKTEVYLQAVDETLRHGRQAIVMVPEISLTPQTVSRFLSRFLGRVGVIHSRLSTGERYDTWRKIRNGEISVVVGARSALFAPFEKLGLIVIDECHDGSYHQEDLSPRYHTVAAAQAYSILTDCQLVIGSATPAVEQLYEYRQNKWPIFELPNRVWAHAEISPDEANNSPASLPLPEVQVVDMRAELVAGNRSALSRVLQTELGSVLTAHNQAILFLNRRGSSSYVFCRDCGYVLKCSRCNNPLTYHENRSILLCHHCNQQRQMPKKCPACNSTRIKQFGLGTESLQKMVADLFPQARLLRWDADTSREKDAHERIMQQFSQQQADILIGTQMLAKGLDLPKVTLVGIVLADVSLNMPDFRAPERTFQLLAQVAGRAGRSALGGKVILQTFHPDHYAIQRAAGHDFSGFEKVELAQRKELGYPPYSRMVRVLFRHHESERVAQTAADAAEHFTHWMRQEGMQSTSMIGPTPCYFQRVAGDYRWQIVLTGPNPLELFQKHPLKEWQSSGIRTDIIVDPLQLL